MKKRLILLCFIFCCNVAVAQHVDIEVVNAINQADSPFLDKFSEASSISVYPMVFAAPISIYCIGWIKKDEILKQKAMTIAASSIISFGLTTILKYSIDRQRPFETYDFIHVRDPEYTPSFPSGHTSASFALATSLSIAFPKWYVIAPAYTWASMVAYSRMYEGVHYPSDIAGGIIVGAGSAILTHHLNKWIIEKRRKKTVIMVD